MRCSICQSINHWATQCACRKRDEGTMIISELVLQNSTDLVLQSLQSKIWDSTVFDSGFYKYFKNLPSGSPKSYTTQVQSHSDLVMADN